MQELKKIYITINNQTSHLGTVYDVGNSLFKNYRYKISFNEKYDNGELLFSLKFKENDKDSLDNFCLYLEDHIKNLENQYKLIEDYISNFQFLTFEKIEDNTSVIGYFGNYINNKGEKEKGSLTKNVFFGRDRK